MSSMRLVAIAFVLAGIGVLAAQPAFEVASVKMSPARTGTARYLSVDTDAAMVRYTNIPLVNLIGMAYRKDSRLVSGPDWINDTVYDVSAKLPPDTPKDKVPDMMQRLLAERFQLAIHRETKEQRAYFLVVA